MMINAYYFSQWEEISGLDWKTTHPFAHTRSARSWSQIRTIGYGLTGLRRAMPRGFLWSWSLPWGIVTAFQGWLALARRRSTCTTRKPDLEVGRNIRESQYVKIDTIAADESFHSGWPGGKKDEAQHGGAYNRAPHPPRLPTLAFQDVGACIALVSVKVYYKKCWSIIENLATFPDTVTGSEFSSLVEVEAHALVTQRRRRKLSQMHCSAEGEWLVPHWECICKVGFHQKGDACECEYFISICTHLMACIRALLITLRKSEERTMKQLISYYYV